MATFLLSSCHYQKNTIDLETKKYLLLAACALLLHVSLRAQDAEGSATDNLPIIVGWQSHNFSLPYRDVSGNFSNPGFFAGTEAAYNKQKTLVQQVTLGWYFNRGVGNGMYVTTQFGFRPKIKGQLYGEVKLGLSYLRVFHPTTAYEYAGGEWRETTGGKSQLGIPFDIGLGYNIDSKIGTLSPFVNYQIMPALFYNESLPFNVYTNVLIGTRITRK